MPHAHDVAGIGDHPQDLYRLSRDELVQRLAQLDCEVRDLREQLQLQQVTDALTGLANRDFFLASFKRLCQRARRFGQQICVALIDVNNFRLINEQHGTLAGDLVLTELADTLRAIVREYDLLARFGEDEFAIALDNGDNKVAQQLAKRIRHAVAARPFCVADRFIPVNVTVGSALAHAELLGDQHDRLIRMAVEAIEVARRKGHNQTHMIEMAAAKATSV